jgi:hypothetical protein
MHEAHMLEPSPNDPGRQNGNHKPRIKKSEWRTMAERKFPPPWSVDDPP